MIRTCSMYPKSPPTSGLSNAPTLMVIRPLSHFLFTNEYKSVHPPQVLSLLDRASLYIQDNNIWTLQGICRKEVVTFFANLLANGVNTQVLHSSATKPQCMCWFLNLVKSIYLFYHQKRANFFARFEVDLPSKTYKTFCTC